MTRAHQLLTRAVLVAALAALPVAAAGCATNPATGKLQFNTLDRDQEIAVGEEAKPQLVQEYGGEVSSPQLTAYVGEIGRRLTQYVEDPAKRDLPWEFIVLDSDVINAFALPGGKVFISRGLLEQFDSEAEIAGVLGHEIGHVTAEHAEQRMGTQMTVGVLGAAASTAAGVFGGSSAAVLQQATEVVVGTAGQGFLLKFSRDEESAADSLGVRYMIAAGYDPQGMLDVLSVLAAASEGGRQLEILSTHPHPETRLTRVRELIEEQYGDQIGNPQLRMGKAEFQQRAKPYL